MSKYLLIGDEHWGASNVNSVLLEQNVKLWAFIEEFIKHNKIDCIIDLGDFFDKRKEIDSNLLNIVKKEVCDRLERLNIDLYAIVGNHNLYFRDSSKVNNIEPLADYCRKVHVIKEPTTLDNIDLIPWISSDNAAMIANFVKHSNSSYCCGHFEFTGFKFDKFSTSKCNEKISKTSFSNYDLVFSGHFHIASRQDNIIYTGTPIQLTWVDVDVKKYIYVLDTDTGGLSTYEVPLELYKQYTLNESTIIDLFNEDIFEKRVKIFYDETFEIEHKKDFENLKINLNKKKPDSIQFIKNPIIKESKTITVNETEDLKVSIFDYIDKKDYKNCELLKKLIDKLY